MRRDLLSAVLASVWTLAGAVLSPAANVYWDDAGGSPSKLWSDFGNWNPDGSVANDVVFVGVDTLGANVAAAANDRTLFDGGLQVFGLTVGNGADVVNSTDDGATNGHQLIVNGATVVGSAGSSIIAYGTGGDAFDTDTLTINDGGVFTLNSQTVQGTAVLEVDTGLFGINAGGALNGNGRIDLEAPAAVVGTPFTALSNDGVISAGHLGLTIFAPPARTLQITAMSADARFDWDGIFGNGVLTVGGNGTLDIDVPTSPDAFDGTMNLQTGGTIDVEDFWSMDSGTINANTAAFGLIIIGQDPNPGPAAHIAGASWGMNGGTINVDDTWDSLQFDSTVSATGGTVNNEGTLIFAANATFNSGVDFNMIGGGASMVVNATVNIDTPDFNLDGDGLSTNVTTINSGGNLDLDLGAGADEDFNHTINLNGGELDVTTTDNNWGLTSSGVVNAGGGATSFINGETFQTGAGTINVAAGSTLQVGATSEFNGAATVVIAAGGTLNMATVTYASPAASFTGGGIFRKGTATVNAATTWNVATVDLDDGDTTLNANLTINADSIEDAGTSMDASIIVNGANALAVNINGGGVWTVGSTGEIQYNGDASVDTFLTGSDIRMNGTINHSGDGRSDARLSIGATGVVNINTPAQPLRLSGGDQAANANRIAGGTVNGLGLLAADAGSALIGFGTINAAIDFDGASDLRADDGVLNVNGAILDVGVIGTADDDGVLNVTNAWNTNLTNTVILDGGELRGALITNDGIAGINGRGLVSARVNNNSRIDAEDDGLLVVQTAANNNDWDGAANTGQLTAAGGDLEVRDDASFLYQGSVTVANGHTATASGFELEFEPASTLMLTGSAYRSTHATDFGGTMTVNAGTASTLRNEVSQTFENGSNTTLSGDVQLESPLNVVQVAQRSPAAVRW